MKRYEILEYATEQINKWRRIDHLVKSHDNLMELEPHLLAGDEHAIKRIVKGNKLTRVALLEVAKDLGIKNYGLMRKEELLNAIKRNKRP